MNAVKTFSWLWWGVPLLLLLAGAVWLGLWWRGTAVDAVTVQSQALVRSLQFSGRVASQTRVDVGSTITGRVLRVSVNEGAEVRRGDVLLALESQELQAALNQAQAAERQAAARLEGLRSTGRSSAQAGLSQALAAERAAQASWERTQQLVAQGFLSPAALDDARRARDVAAAQVASAQAQGRASSERGTEVAQAMAQLSLAQAATQAARARLAQTELVAPADGRVLVREVEPGQIVQPGKALLSLALAGPVQISAPVDERFLDQLRTGQPAAVVADAYTHQRFAARVLSIAPSVDAQRGSVEVKLALDGEAPAFLREDMTLSVEVETGRRDTALVLPLGALRTATDAEQAEVMVVDAGVARLRTVGLGLRTLTSVEVLDGLTSGEQVLLGSAVQDGQRVRPQARTAAASSKASADAGSALTNAMGR